MYNVVRRVLGHRCLSRYTQRLRFTYRTKVNVSLSCALSLPMAKFQCSPFDFALNLLIAINHPNKTGLALSMHVRLFSSGKSAYIQSNFADKLNNEIQLSAIAMHPLAFKSRERNTNCRSFHRDSELKRPTPKQISWHCFAISNSFSAPSEVRLNTAGPLSGGMFGLLSGVALSRDANRDRFVSFDSRPSVRREKLTAVRCQIAGKGYMG